MVLKSLNFKAISMEKIYNKYLSTIKRNIFVILLLYSINMKIIIEF